MYKINVLNIKSNMNKKIENENEFKFNNLNEFIIKCNELINLNLEYKKTIFLIENTLFIELRYFKYIKNNFKNYNDMKLYEMNYIKLIINFNNFNELKEIMKELKIIKCNSYIIKENILNYENMKYKTIYDYSYNIYDIFKKNERKLLNKYKKDLKEKLLKEKN